jgi:sigma-B regulation protein RsbU (phosphoserine phosphatase)
VKVQDLSHNLRIASLTKLTRNLAKAETPEQTLRALHEGFAEAYGFIASVLLSTREMPQGQYRVVGTRLEGGRVKDPPGREPSVLSGGIMSAITARPEPQLIQDVEWESDPHFSEMLSGYASIIAIPLAGTHLPMTWALLLKRRPEQFTVSDLEEAVQRIALIASLLENQTLAQRLIVANEQIDKDARQVGELQRALLPKNLPQLAGLEVAASYEPSGRAGGDLYDIFSLDECRNDQTDDKPASTRWCIFIGDAAGHGLAAAVVMAIVQSVLHSRPDGIAGPAELLMHANRELCRKNIGGFVTAFLGIYEPVSRQLIYVNAGHPPPLLKRRANEKICALDAVGTAPLGIDEAQIFKEAMAQLEPGDTVLLYTDGITEARNTKGDLFEQERIVRTFRSAGEGPASLIDHLRGAVQGHEQGQSPKDDQTLVAARVS